MTWQAWLAENNNFQDDGKGSWDYYIFDYYEIVNVLYGEMFKLTKDVRTTFGKKM